MWLWSLAWCAQWLAGAGRAPDPCAGGQDCSTAHSQATLVRHVAERVGHYPRPDTVTRVLDGLNDLERTQSATRT